MKKHRKLLIIGLVFAFVAVFSVTTVSAAWMTNATINSVQVSANGDYFVKATLGTWTKVFTIQSTDANAKALLASALTAYSNGNTITIQFTGVIIDNLYLK